MSLGHCTCGCECLQGYNAFYLTYTTFKLLINYFSFLTWANSSYFIPLSSPPRVVCPSFGKPARPTARLCFAAWPLAKKKQTNKQTKKTRGNTLSLP